MSIWRTKLHPKKCRKDKMEKEKYCKCKSGLILANLETGKGECPLCKLPKKLDSRLKGMSEIYQDKTLRGRVRNR